MHANRNLVTRYTQLLNHGEKQQLIKLTFFISLSLHTLFLCYSSYICIIHGQSRQKFHGETASNPLPFSLSNSLRFLPQFPLSLPLFLPHSFHQPTPTQTPAGIILCDALMSQIFRGSIFSQKI